MKRSRTARWVATIAAAALVVASCGGDDDDDADAGGSTDNTEASSESGEPITVDVGIVLPLSGPVSAVGNSVRQGVELFVKDAAEDERYSDLTFELHVEDDEDKPEVAVNLVTKLMTEGVSAVIGPADSGATLASIEVANRNETALITPVGANPQITESGSEWVYRTSANDEKQAGAVAEAITAADVSSVVILHINDAYGQGGEEVLRTTLEEGDVEVLPSVPYPRDSQDFTAEATRALNENPDGIVIWGTQADSAAILKIINDQGFTGPVFGSGGLGAPFFVNLAGDLAENIIFPTTFVASRSDLATSFAERYEAEYDAKPDQFAAQGYAAAQAVAEAALAGGSGDAADVGPALKSVDFDSPIGELTFDETGDSVVVVQLARWENGVAVEYTP